MSHQRRSPLHLREMYFECALGAIRSPYWRHCYPMRDTSRSGNDQISVTVSSRLRYPVLLSIEQRVLRRDRLSLGSRHTGDSDARSISVCDRLKGIGSVVPADLPPCMKEPACAKRFEGESTEWYSLCMRRVHG